MAERAQGKIPPGLYLRDISEVREGSDSFHFTNSLVPPKDPDNCLSLIGSERTVCLELPSKVSFKSILNCLWSNLCVRFSFASQFTRDWFLARFRLLAEDILVEQEKRLRQYKFWENSKHLNQVELSGVEQLRTMLEGGIQVLHHQRNTGLIEPSVLKFDSKTTTFELTAMTPLGWFKPAIKFVSFSTALYTHATSYFVSFMHPEIECIRHLRGAARQSLSGLRQDGEHGARQRGLPPPTPLLRYVDIAA